MLKLTDITKTYLVGDERIPALKNVNIEFRNSEFVAILGHSGCGKTTLLNIIGGLDQYTSGDLIISHKSTKDFSDADWDTYRNHSVGFVFQSYNLIPHQTVLSNVELALTLSGVSKAERRKRAIEALEKVGLGDQINKKPNQMSGGQMQRVAIARALVNNPEILLADEPTGALDSATSVQIMDILRTVAQDRLVIMVTHNPELADAYATRTVRLLDGEIIDDSNPYVSEETEVIDKKKQGKTKHTSMSFLTALSLSANNLMTKKARTLLTSFAGSIGIIGIALILAVSTGVQTYINRVQEDTLASYPLAIQSQTVDMSGMITSMMEIEKDKEENPHDLDKVYANSILYDLLNSINKIETTQNDLSPLIEHLNNSETFHDIATMQYVYNMPMNIYTTDKDGAILKSDVAKLFETLFAGMYQDGTATQMAQMYSSYMSIWQEMLPGKDGALFSELLDTQYDVIHGSWPKNENEIVLIVNENNEISDLVLYALGLRTANELYESLEQASKGEDIDTSNLESWKYEDICSLSFRLIPAFAGYEKMENGVFVNTAMTPEGLEELYNSDQVIPLKISGIIRPSKDAVSAMMNGSIGYTYALTEKLIDMSKDSEVIKAQLDAPDTNVLTGMPFVMPGGDAAAPGMSLYPQYTIDQSTILSMLGYVDRENPTTLNIYVSTFADKDTVAEIIDAYNAPLAEEEKITYTDYVALLMSSITTIIDAISYVLIGFVAVSLFVSSIMIGIITYISVLERTKEIGILRAIGASKWDISLVFNAETVIVGLSAGAIGIGVSLFCVTIINIILHALTNIPNLNAVLPAGAALILVALSMVLSLVAGLFPALLAAMKDPVIALRSE